MLIHHIFINTREYFSVVSLNYEDIYSVNAFDANYARFVTKWGCKLRSLFARSREDEKKPNEIQKIRGNIHRFS